MIAPAGYGTAMAVDMARAAERAGADGLLPRTSTKPTRKDWPPMRAVCAATSLGVIVYSPPTPSTTTQRQPDA